MKYKVGDYVIVNNTYSDGWLGKVARIKKIYPYEHKYPYHKYPYQLELIKEKTPLIDIFRVEEFRKATDDEAIVWSI